MLDIPHLMNGLSRERPIFHSEADFQHALAWWIHETIPDGGVRLEWRPFSDERLYLDLWFPEIGVAVELKYRTLELDREHCGESFVLRNQSAQDQGRYDFLRDVERLERVSKLPSFRAGFAILLTNDASYWNRSSRTETVDRAFRLHEGRRIDGDMDWSPKASPGTTKNRPTIRLEGSYDLRWRDYATMGQGGHGRFRYLAVESPV